MRALWTAAILVLFGACAEGVDPVPDSEIEAVIQRGQLPPSTAGTSASVGQDAGSMAGAGGGMQEPQYMGEPCQRGEVADCVCPSTGTMGTKSCKYDPASPTDGTFSECGNCQEMMSEPEDAGMSMLPGEETMPGGEGDDPPSGSDCADGMQNGSESDVDCGGPDCPSCLLGKACNNVDDCSAGECLDGVCAFPMDEGGGGGGFVGGGGGNCDCDNSCFPVGVLACCTALGTCGCTWAPGAYCF